MTNTFSTSKTAVKNSSFYPFASNLKDQPVFVFGGGNQAYREILRLVDAGVILTVVAAQVSDQIGEISVTHASRVKVLSLSAQAFLDSKPDLSQYRLAFLLCESAQDNELLARALTSAKVPCNLIHEPDDSDFVSATMLKRGHLKIAVSTDGICQPLERAMARRIEELFIYDFDHYSIFLAALEEKLVAFRESNPEGWSRLNLMLEHEDFYLALSRKNFDEALRLVDNHMGDIASGRDADEGEIEISRPRDSGKNGPSSGKTPQ